jgi:hypothetical protein
MGAKGTQRGGMAKRSANSIWGKDQAFKAGENELFHRFLILFFSILKQFKPLFNSLTIFGLSE